MAQTQSYVEARLQFRVAQVSHAKCRSTILEQKIQKRMVMRVRGIRAMFEEAAAYAR